LAIRTKNASLIDQTTTASAVGSSSTAMPTETIPIPATAETLTTSMMVDSTLIEDVNSSVVDEDCEVEGILKNGVPSDIGTDSRANSVTSTPTIGDTRFHKRQKVKGKWSLFNCQLVTHLSYTLQM